MSQLFVGLMSGTSMDGVDAVLADFSVPPLRVLGHRALPYDDALRDELLALNARGGADELHRSRLAANRLARVYAQAVADLLEDLAITPNQVRAIGSHGQTLRHRPGEFDGLGYTLQLDQPALLAELTGIDVVADFRSRDVAAGGQGAPLAPFFHRAALGAPGKTVAVLNIGGISNLSLLRAGEAPLGFDCGPGNALMDGWIERHRGARFDAEGAWAASGAVDQALLDHMLADSYFSAPPPKSTGRDRFNADWLQAQLRAAPMMAAPERPAQDVQASLTELTARCCADALLRHGGQGPSEPDELVVCGGGAFNTHLMRRLQAHLPAHRVCSSADKGLAPLQVEAAAFAWLARQCVERQALDLPTTTGAKGARVLGCVYPR